jgi:2-keto-3-deoxy-L-arabinonate dehydratase
MTGGGYPDGIRQIVDAYRKGRREEAVDAYNRWLPLINYENRQTGVIASEAVHHPLQPLHPQTRAGLIETAQRLDPMVLRWAR